jgi:magnesium transporter
MARFIKTKKETIGLSPDAIHFRGEKKSDHTKLSIINFNSEDLQEYEATTVQEIAALIDETKTSWFNIDGLHDEKIMHELALEFNIDTLIISNVLQTHARPKIYEYDDCIYISVKMLQFNEKKNRISSENLVLIFKENLLISFQEKVGDVFEPVRDRLRKNRKRIRSSGPDYLTFALLDIVIDNYIYIISRIGENIELLDEKLINNPSQEVIQEINKFKGEINYLRKIIKPCREMIMRFVKMESDFIQENIHVYLKELQHNIDLANDSVDSYREILSDQLSILHSNMSNKLNDILKFLTIFSVIFIPLTFIAGIYGTNFDYIPELRLQYGYFMMWGIMIAIAIGMIFYFKKKKWF